MIPSSEQLHFVPHLAARDIDAKDWNALLNHPSFPQAIPMMAWEWFAAFENSGSISIQNGFRPAHLAVFRGKKLIAIAPLYWKRGQEAEWTASGFLMEMAYRGQAVLPERLIGIIPFTPVPGYRFLIDPQEDSFAIAQQIFRFLESLVSGEGGQRTLLQLQHIDSKMRVWADLHAIVFLGVAESDVGSGLSGLRSGSRQGRANLNTYLQTVILNLFQDPIL